MRRGDALAYPSALAARHNIGGFAGQETGHEQRRTGLGIGTDGVPARAYGTGGDTQRPLRHGPLGRR